MGRPNDLVIMSLGLGSVFVATATAANAGVRPDKAGLAAALLNASQQLGGALGLAILSAVATSRTHHLLATHGSPVHALDGGHRRALLVGALFELAAAVIALRVTNTRGERPETAAAPSTIAELEAAMSWRRRVTGGQVSMYKTIVKRTIVVDGWPWDTRIATHFSVTATLRGGHEYRNGGLQFIRLRWGKVIEDHRHSARRRGARLSLRGWRERGGRGTDRMTRRQCSEPAAPDAGSVPLAVIPVPAP